MTKGGNQNTRSNHSISDCRGWRESSSRPIHGFEAWAVAELLSEQHKVGETTSLDNFSGKLLNFILKQWNMKLYIQ